METPTVVNASLFWANLTQVNTLSQKYQIDIGQLSDDAVAALEEKGIPVKNKDDERGQFITAKSKNPIKAVTPAGEELPVMIGNGSKAKVVLSYYDWTSPTGSKGRSASIVKLIVTELEEYEAVEVTDEVLENAL